MSDDDAIGWARATGFAGWAFLLAYLGVVTGIVRRAAALSDSSFEDGLWWQRVEIISFAALPQNLIVIVPAVAAGVVVTMYTDGESDLLGAFDAETGDERCGGSLDQVPVVDRRFESHATSHLVPRNWALKMSPMGSESATANLGRSFSSPFGRDYAQSSPQLRRSR